jgi:CRISPR-associated protein Csx17
LWGLTLIDWKKPGLVKVQRKWEYPIARSIVSRTWCLLKLLHIPGEIRGIKIKRERSVSSLLLAGRTDEACDRAIQRLRITGLQPFPVNFAEEIRPTRLLASLIIPVKDQHLLEEMVLEKQTHTGEVYV